MAKNWRPFGYITKSKFLRSLFLQVLSIFLVVSIAIIAIVFFSFAGEINRNILSDKRARLAVIEDTISGRMEEVASIAYNIGQDSSFYLEPVDGNRYTGYELSATLGRYLVGNGFIQYLAYYRLSEPDTLYTSRGKLSFSDFWGMYLGVDQDTANTYIQGIQSATEVTVTYIATGQSDRSYFSYLCPLPQFSKKPQAFVLMLMPFSEVETLLASQLLNASGEVLVFDARGNELCCVSNLTERFPIDPDQYGASAEETYTAGNGEKYVVLKQVSDSNGWTYVSVIRRSDIISGLAGRQLLFIVLLLVLMFVAVFVMLICITVQYKPISNLAAAATGESPGGGQSVIDESALLTSSFATLRDDSEQKQRFETAYHAAEAANKAKSAFLSSMSHDIRTPMNAVIGMTELAYKHADDPAYVRKSLEKVRSASRYLMDIINNVLDMSRIESSRIVLSEEVVSLPDMIRELTTILNQSVEAKNQRLTMELEDVRDPRVIVDGVRLMQICMNILSNSVKFTPEGGAISLRVRQAEPGEEAYGDYTFLFSDNGIGMSPDFIGRVFDTFSRSKEADASKVEGTGLGMAIVKNLVELMGGTVACESELGMGTTFTVCLRLQLAPPEEGSAGNAPADGDARIPDLTGRRVLIVDDNRINREVARAVIGSTHATVDEAANGEEAVRAFSQRPEGYYDLILMDVQMPVMNGYEATAAIRAMTRPDAANVPIYALTGSTFFEDVRQVREAGMNGHVGKPYTPGALYKALEQAIRP